MSKPTIRIHNLETDEIIDREMTDDELAILEKEQDEVAKIKAKEELKNKKRQEILEKLGLDEQEAKLLLG